MGHPGNDWWLPLEKYGDLGNYKGWAHGSVNKHDQMSTMIIFSNIFNRYKVEENKKSNVRISIGSSYKKHFRRFKSVQCVINFLWYIPTSLKNN